MMFALDLKMGKGGLPDRWLDYKPVNRAIFRFIPFKVPLKRTICCSLPPDQQFDWPRLISDLERKELQLGLVIDLCNTNRYYDPVDIEKASSNKILHFKIYCQGHDQTPSDEDFYNFATQVKEFLRHSSDNLYIGVHCTHGVNRTGFLICKFLILFEGWEPAVAVKSFTTARGHEFDKKFYVKHLLKLMPDRREDPPRYSPARSTSAVSKLHQHKFFSDSESDDNACQGGHQSQSVIERRSVQYEDCRRYGSEGGYRGEGSVQGRQQSSAYSRNDDRPEFSRYPNVNRGRDLSPETRRTSHESQMPSRKRSGDRGVMNYDKNESYVPSRKESSIDYARAPARNSRDKRSSPHFIQRDREPGLYGKGRFSSRHEDLNIPPINDFPPGRGEEKDRRMNRGGGGRRLSPRDHQEEHFKKRRSTRSPRRDQFFDRTSNQDSRSPYSSKPPPLMIDHPGDHYRKRETLLADPPPLLGSDRRHFHDDRSSLASNKPPPSKYSRLSRSPRNDYQHSRLEREPVADFPRHSNAAFSVCRNDRVGNTKDNLDLHHGSSSRKNVPRISPGVRRFERREERYSDLKYAKFPDDLNEVARGEYSPMGRPSKESERPRERSERDRECSPLPRPHGGNLGSSLGRDRGSGILSHPSIGRTSYSPLRSQVIANDRRSLLLVSKTDNHFSDRSAVGCKTGRTASGIEFSLPDETMSNKLKISDYQSQSVLSPSNSPPRHYRSVEKGPPERTDRGRLYDQETGLGFRDTREHFHGARDSSRERVNPRSPDGPKGRFDRGAGGDRGIRGSRSTDGPSGGLRSFRGRGGRFVTDRRGGGPPRMRGGGGPRGGLGSPRFTSRGGPLRGGSRSFRSNLLRGSAAGGRGLFSINAREKLAAGDGRPRQNMGPGRGRGSANSGHRLPRSRGRPMRGSISR